MNATPVAGLVALVAEDHLHDVHRRAEVVRDPVRAPVDLRARRVPRVEDGSHGARAAARVDPAGSRDRSPPGRSACTSRSARPGRRRTGRRPARRRVPSSDRRAPARTGGRRSRRPPRRTSGSAAGTSRRRSARCRLRARALATASSFSPRLRIVSIIPGIETAAPERTDTSSGSSRVAEALAGLLLERAEVLLDLLFEPVRQRLAVRHVRAAGVGRDREARPGPGRPAASSRRDRPPCRRAARGRRRTARRSRRRSAGRARRESSHKSPAILGVVPEPTIVADGRASGRDAARLRPRPRAGNAPALRTHAAGRRARPDRVLVRAAARSRRR